MTQLIIPIGIPGCGKSTWATRFFNKSTDIIWSTDNIRARPEFGGDVKSQERNNDVFEFFHTAIRESLQDSFRVVADATNLTSKARRTLYDIAYETGAECHIVLFKNNAQALARNILRERTVPEQAMMRMLYNYEDTLIRLSLEKRFYKTVTTIGEVN